MSNAYDLSKLEPKTFEHLVNALALKVLGAGATGFGPGADAGRDGFFEGRAPYPSTEDVWDGVWYIQSKFHAPHLTANAQDWLLAQIKQELAAFKDPEKGRCWPDNWILATNVEISAGRGGVFDKARKLVARERPEIARRFHIWGGQKISDLLGQDNAIARRYGHFFTPGHVLSALMDGLQDDRVSIEEIVRVLVVQGLKDNRRTRIDQANYREDQAPGIEALFVDLPFVDVLHKVAADAVKMLSIASAQVHRFDDSEGWGEAWARWRRHPSRADVWFVRAGPGRGKSTIGQFFCQVQRAALLEQDKTILRRPDIDEIVQQIRSASENLKIWPSMPRIPVWVELKAYAAWYAERPVNEPKGIFSWLATDLRRILENNVAVGTIQRALRQSSWFVVFDGLDEVPSGIKDGIAKEVVRFVEEASVTGDVMTLCTSRPQGYSGQFDALGGAVIELVDLNPEQALECACRVTCIGRTIAESAKARATLERALQTPAVSEIMTTPLQAHIMAVLVRNGARPPERKWDLYDRFYRVIREREANRDLPDPRLKALLQGDTTIIDGVHQRLAFVLHARAETAEGANASFSRAEFRSLVRDVIERFGTHGDLDEMVDVVTSAATDRLVLISTPDNGSHVRFDIRAIQEFFAAEFIYVDVDLHNLRSRLEVIVGDSHWREVVQFLFGALISTRRRTERTEAFDALRWLDHGQGDPSHRTLAQRLAIGARHAGVLVSNGVAESDQQVRAQMRDLLDPLAHSSDADFLEILGRSSGPQTRGFLWTWARDHIRSGATAAGVATVLAALCYTSPPIEDEFQALVKIMPTRVLDMLFRRLERHEDVPLHAWERNMVSELFDREDVVRNARESVILVLQTCSEFRGHWYRKQLDAEAEKAAGLRGLFAERIETYGALEVGVFVLTPAGQRRLARTVQRHSHQRPAVRWLTKLMIAARNPSVIQAQEIYAELGGDWSILQALPEELSRGIPVPLARVPGSKIVEVLKAANDSEFANSLSTLQLVDIPLRRTGSQILSFAPDPPPLIPVLDEILVKRPELAGQALTFICGPFARSSERQFTPSVVSGYVVKNSTLTIDVDGLAFVWLLNDEHEGVDVDHLRPLFQSAGCKARIDISWVYGSSPRLQLKFPDDTGILVFLASRALGEIRRTIDTRYVALGDTGFEPQDWVTYAIPRIEDLYVILDDTSISVHLRASAAFLCALHRSGGLECLYQREHLLVALAKEGVCIAAGVALLIEAACGGGTPESRRLLAIVLDVNHEPPFPQAIDAVLNRWRERSHAPVTTGWHLNEWLAMR